MRDPEPLTPSIDARARTARIEYLHSQLRDRIMLLDGAMGTAIQGFNLDDADFRGSRFRDHPVALQGG